jgi:hypothetical protein
MKGKSERKRDDPEQSKRFIETAKKVGADKDEDALDRAFTKIAPQKRQHENGESK